MKIQKAQVNLPQGLAPVTTYLIGDDYWVTIRSLSQAVAYNVRPYLTDNIVIRNIEGCTCIDSDNIAEILTDLPDDAFRAKAVFKEMAMAGMRTSISPDGVLTNPVTGKRYQMARINGEWMLRSDQLSDILGVAESEIQETLASMQEKLDR